MVPQGSPEVIYCVHPPIYILDDEFMSFLYSDLLCSHSSYDFDSYFPEKIEARSLSLMFPPAHHATYLHLCHTFRLFSTSVHETAMLPSAVNSLTNALDLIPSNPPEITQGFSPAPPVQVLCSFSVISFSSANSHAEFLPHPAPATTPFYCSRRTPVGFHLCHCTKQILSRVTMTSMLLNPMTNY